MFICSSTIILTLYCSTCKCPQLQHRSTIPSLTQEYPEHYIESVPNDTHAEIRSWAWFLRHVTVTPYNTVTKVLYRLLYSCPPRSFGRFQGRGDVIYRPGAYMWSQISPRMVSGNQHAKSVLAKGDDTVMIVHRFGPDSHSPCPLHSSTTTCKVRTWSPTKSGFARN